MSEFNDFNKNVIAQFRENGGKVGLLIVSDLRPDIAAAIKNVKAGAVTDPFKTDEGYQILRVDTRTAGSSAFSVMLWPD